MPIELASVFLLCGVKSIRTIERGEVHHNQEFVVLQLIHLRAVVVVFGKLITSWCFWNFSSTFSFNSSIRAASSLSSSMTACSAGHASFLEQPLHGAVNVRSFRVHHITGFLPFSAVLASAEAHAHSANLRRLECHKS